jgi:MFS superfamily sulfate permease-like transporter
MDPNGILIAFGVSLIAIGWIYKTPFPVQPMKAIGATSVSQAAIAGGLTSAVVVSASLMTGVIWLILGLTGLASKVAKWVPKSALLGVILGLGFILMIEGVKMMSSSLWIAAPLLLLTLFLLSRPKIPAMLVLLFIGGVIAMIQQPELASQLRGLELSPALPSFAWSSLTATDLISGLVLLALPQLPLTFGNAYLSITEENNKLFPERPVTQKSVALSTSAMNFLSSTLGGVPMCHGAGGMAGHVMFGARTGGSSIILGSALLLLGVFFSNSISTILTLFPACVLGIILFFAGLQLALSSRDESGEKVDRFIVLATAGIAMWNVGIAILFGIVIHFTNKRGWIRL